MEESEESKRRPPSPAPTCVSMKSDWSMDHIVDFKGDTSPQQSNQGKRSHSAVVSPCEPLTQQQRIQAELRLSEHSQLYDHRQQLDHVQEMHQIQKSHLQKRFQCLIEGSIEQGKSTELNEVYTDLYITEGGRGEVNDEHEVRQMERASWTEEKLGKPIKCRDIFKPGSGQAKPIRSVLTKGVAGIGKTVSVRKFIVDWAEGKANQDVDFIFPFLFREMNLMREKKLSLVGLIQHFYPEIKAEELLTSSKHRVMFIFDGLDEWRIPLQFNHSSKCCDVTEQVSIDMLLTNLIQGNLLPSALLWITTRPAAASQIPHDFVNQVTEIRGFNNPQKEEYFGKRISDENLASRVIRHLKSSRSLYIMCHIPVFCWIAAIVAERTSEESDKAEMPRTMTQMYSRFLIIQTSIRKDKYTERKETEEEIISKLGKLAFQQLEKGNLIFYEEDLREVGIDVTEASVYSGVCTQIFRKENDVYQAKVFSFVHLSIQEFLAALYVFLCFSNRGRNMSDQQQSYLLSALFGATTLHDLHKTAVHLALQSRTGHLDLFLRFLLGLSLESNQNLLQHLLPKTSSQSHSSVQTVQCIKENIRGESRSHRRINLFYCLNELNQHAVVERTDRKEGQLYVQMLLPGEWETVTFTLGMSEEQLDGFDLQEHIETPEKNQTELLNPDDVLQKLVPVVTTATMALLGVCKLTEKSCPHLVSVLSSHSSRLTCLILRENDLYDSGVELLCSGLQHQHCRLETLGLHNCKLTEKSCSHLVSVLSSYSSRLTCLFLNYNELFDSGVEHLCSGLQHQHCRLKTLVLNGCNLTRKSCSLLVSVLSSHSSRLKELHLQGNGLSASDVEQLSALEKDPNCRLETLWWTHYSNNNVALAKTTQSLTTAADMREMTKMLMQPNANWEEYLTPAPLSIAIMGELVFISSDVKNDFSINKNPPPKGFQYINYPDSFRACLMQICNSGWEAFNEAHKNMDQIHIHTGSVPNYMKEAVKILFNSPDNVIDKLMPNQLKNISDIANECVQLAEGVEQKYSTVIHVIQELLQACVNVEHFYGEELENIKTTMKEAQLREKMAKEFNDRSKKAMEAMGQQVEEAQNAYKQAMELIPTGWEMIGMDFLEGLANSVNSIINGCTKSMSNVGIKGMLHRVSFAEEMDITSDMKILSSSGAILEIMGSLIQNVIEDKINWKNLCNQKTNSMNSDWTKTQFQKLKDDIGKCPDSQVKMDACSLLKRGIAVCEDLAAYYPDQKWDSKKTKKLITDLQSLKNQAHVFDSKSKKQLGSPALGPMSPMMSKALTNSLGDTSVSQAATENAHFRIEQSREQLKQTREQYNKCVENMEKNQKELTDILCELQNCEIQEIDFETTIKMLVKGMDAMGRVKQQWEKMVRFFQMVSNIIKTSLHRTLTKFVTAESTKARMYNIKLFSKDLLYNQVFQASNIASLVHMISGTYTEVSSKYLMDRMSSLGKLMAMDKSKPEFMIERLNLQESCRKAQDGIFQLVMKSKEEFEKNTDARMASIEGGLKAILPSAAPETTERLKEIVQAGFAGKEQPQTVL